MEVRPGKQKLVKDISASTLQTAVTQFFGLLVFYLMSKYLSKADFGEFNWAMAVGGTFVAVLSLGLDLVLVKKVASGHNVEELCGIHFFHTLLAGVVSIGGTLLLSLLPGTFSEKHPFFLAILLSLLVGNVANSFKLGLNGLEAFKSLAQIAILASLSRVSLILLLYYSGNFGLAGVIGAYALSSALELVTGYYFVNRKLNTRLKPRLHLAKYRQLIGESLPQLGVVVFDSALARIDWILLGVMSSVVATADYSFVYKVFELSKFPLLVVAPVLLTRFSKLFAVKHDIDDQNRVEIRVFFRFELFLVMILPVLLLAYWSPLIDFFTANRYGAVNRFSFWMLAPCVPMLCMVNYLWTLGFVQGQLRLIMFVTIGVSLLNVALNMVFIPFYGGPGAAAAFLLSTVVQLVLYIVFVQQNYLRLYLSDCFLALATAALSAGVAMYFLPGSFSGLVALLLHGTLAFATGQLKFGQLKQFIKK